MAERNYYYERYKEDCTAERCPQDDKDGKISGHLILNLPAWFDENPEERKRLGWIKHITKDTSKVEYDRQTQFLVKSVRQIDEFTVEDVYNVLTKSEEQLAFEEMLSVAMMSDDNGIVFF